MQAGEEVRGMGLHAAIMQGMGRMAKSPRLERALDAVSTASSIAMLAAKT